MTTPRKVVRCAIYCRKSSDEGLEQQFNSLDAQRMAAEAYIASQASLGWTCMPEHYDDGGISGGTIERPALQRLLADIDAGLVDAVLVYKLDRLSRSIRDFGNLMGKFEERGVALVSVTQSINTSDSMGRLILNVLMSFAQFERELASERTRDKIAMSRKKGLWTGGRPVLGYDIVDGNLVINPGEAELVRWIFARYIAIKSLDALSRELEGKGIRNKSWTAISEKVIGGGRLAKSTLCGLLGNVLYVGRVPHKEVSFEGRHEAIVTDELFAQVQRQLAQNRNSGTSALRGDYGGLLKGVLHCQCCGGRMIHNVVSKGGNVSYRYYICQTRSGAARRACGTPSLPADQIETLVVGKVHGMISSSRIATQVFDAVRAEAEAEIRQLAGERDALVGQLEAMPITTGDSTALEHRAAIEEQVASLGRDIRKRERSLVSREQVEGGLGEFQTLWSCLSPTERRAVIAALLERVVFDGKAGEVRLVARGKNTNEEAA